MVASPYCSGSWFSNNQALGSPAKIDYYLLKNNDNNSNRPLPASHISVEKGGKHPIVLHSLA